MAKRRRSSTRRRRSSGLLGGSMMTGIIKPRGLLGQAILGAGAATLAENTGLASGVPLAKYVAGGAVGGIGGIMGVFARDMLKSKGGIAQAAMTNY